MSELKLEVMNNNNPSRSSKNASKNGEDEKNDGLRKTHFSTPRRDIRKRNRKKNAHRNIEKRSHSLRTSQVD